MSLKLESKIKKEIVEGYNRGDILQRVRKEFGLIRGIEFWYDICYNTICSEMGINRKRGEELKPTKVKLIPRREGDND
jgi:hypothetical protein